MNALEQLRKRLEPIDDQFPKNPTDRATCVIDGTKYIFLDRYSSWFAIVGERRVDVGDKEQ